MSKIEARSGITYGWRMGDTGVLKDISYNMLMLGRWGLHLSASSIENTPPASPVNGQTHIVGSNPTNIFTDKIDMLAMYDGEAWVFAEPMPGTRCYMKDSHGLAVYTGSTWSIIGEQEQNMAFGGVPWAVPGTILMADYDLGGNGVGYYDVTPGNNGDSDHRAGDDVDMWHDATEGVYVISNASEWLKYTINAASAGAYKVVFRCRTDEFKTLVIRIDGAKVNLSQSGVGNTNGAWENSLQIDITIPSAGMHELKIEFFSSQTAISKMTLTKA